MIECDELNHDDRNKTEEKIRENFILSHGNKMIRFNPNHEKFDLSNVLVEIHKILYPEKKNNSLEINNSTLILLP